MTELRFTCNQIAMVRREKLDGKQYLVAPVVAICEGVLNGELVSADEIAAHFHSWDGRPFVVDHPKDAEGESISANEPETLARRQIGQLFHTAFEGGKLKGEVWVDLSRVPVVDRAPEVVQRLESGRPLEVSTAYFRDRDEKSGKWQGQAYEAVARNLKPDHLAALLDVEGACSWEDGCGAPRVNKGVQNQEPGEPEPGGPELCVCPECGHEVAKERGVPCRSMECPECGAALVAGGEGVEPQANVLDEARTPSYSGTEEISWAKISKSFEAYRDGFYKHTDADEPDESISKVEDAPQVMKTWIASKSLLGDPKADNWRDLLFFPVVNPGTDKLNAGAVRAAMGGRAAGADIPQAAKDSARRVALGLLNKEFRSNAMEENGNIVLRVLAAITGALGMNQLSEEVKAMSMSKEQMVKALADGELVGLSEDKLTGLDADVLRALMKLVRAAQKEPQSNEPEPDQEPDPEPEGNENDPPCGQQAAEILPELLELANAVKARGGLDKMLSALDGVQANEDAKKAVLVEELASNSACAFTKERLAEMPMGDLKALKSSLTPPDYSGQGGGPQANADEIEVLEMPDIFAPEKED